MSALKTIEVEVEGTKERQSVAFEYVNVIHARSKDAP